MKVKFSLILQVKMRLQKYYIVGRDAYKEALILLYT